MIRRRAGRGCDVRASATAMTFIPIDDLDDPRLAVYRHLKNKNETLRAGLFVCEGSKLVERLLASRFPVASLLLGQRWAETFAPRVADAVPVYVVPDAWFERLVGFNFHRGVLACARRLPGRPCEELLADAPEGGGLIVCAGIHDRENLGSIFRSALALGARGAIIGPDTCDPFDRRVLRVSMGASLRLPLAFSRDLARDLTTLREQQGIELMATVLDPAAETLGRRPCSRRFALLLGNEAHGLPPHLVELCQRKITIPMSAEVDSLNVAVTAGIVLHELLRGGAPRC
ncbi:MAG: RNA methyltransferase [Pirellulales bacterium]|nr:RNA methyltransferase [Pirellulales bacterium]